MPASLPSRMHAVATPPLAPCTSTLIPGRRPARTKSARYAVRYAVGRHAASARLTWSGSATRFAAGISTYSASAPAREPSLSMRNDRQLRGSSARQAAQCPQVTIGYTTTLAPTAGAPDGGSPPYASTSPAASQPRMCGGVTGADETPRSVQMSWWLRDAARTLTRAQPGRGTGAGSSPTVRLASGFSPPTADAYTASISGTVAWC